MSAEVVALRERFLLLGRVVSAIEIIFGLVFVGLAVFNIWTGKTPFDGGIFVFWGHVIAGVLGFRWVNEPLNANLRSHEIAIKASHILSGCAFFLGLMVPGSVFNESYLLFMGITCFATLALIFRSYTFFQKRIQTLNQKDRLTKLGSA